MPALIFTFLPRPTCFALSQKMGTSDIANKYCVSYENILCVKNLLPSVSDRRIRKVNLVFAHYTHCSSVELNETKCKETYGCTAHTQYICKNCTF